MTVYELIQKLSEAPADTEVLVNVVADGMLYRFEDDRGRDCCIGVDIDERVKICDAFERNVRGENKIIIDLFAL